MPVKKEKKKAGHFMSYFRHKLLNLKDAWKRKKKENNRPCIVFIFFEKMPEKKRKEKETGHFMSILYSIMTCVAVCSKVYS